MAAAQGLTAASGGVVLVAFITPGGPFSEVFGEIGLVMALMGAAGGGARGFALATPWRATFRSIALGALLSFGLGVLAPLLLEEWLGIVIAPDTSAVPLLAASAFVVGMAQERIVKLMLSPRGKGDKD